MSNPWRDHLAAYRKKHPSSSLKDAMKAAAATYKKSSSGSKSSVKQKGGNPAIIGAVASAVPGAVNSIADSVKKGVEAQHEFNRDNGKLAAEKASNYNQFYRDLIHKRYHDPEQLPSRLRLKRFGIDPPSRITDPKLSANRDRADDALEEYAEKQFDKFQASVKKGGSRRKRT